MPRSYNFAEARNFVRGQNFKSISEYRDYAEYFNKLPKHPEKAYIEWAGWGDFIGIDEIKYNPFSFSKR